MNYMYEKLRNHVGHHIVCVSYGNEENPTDICLECEDCGEVLVSAEDYKSEKQNYKYYLAVATGMGYAGYYYTLDYKLNSCENIQKVHEKLRQDLGVDTVVILFFKEIN